MRLLICTSEYYPIGAGVANRVYNLVFHLQKIGVKCTVCSPTGPDIKLGSSVMIKKFGILGRLYYWYQIINYFRERIGDYDIVWLNNPLIITNNPFPKSLVTIDSTYYGKSKHKIFSLPLHLYYKLSTIIEKHCLRKVNNGKIKFVVLTSQLLNELDNLGVDKQNIACILNGVDSDRFKPSNIKGKLRKKFNLPEEGIILLSLGRLSDVKQPYKLIELFSLIEKYSKNVTLIVAGDGELLEKIKTLARKMGMERVRFLGHVDYLTEVPDIYACSDYLIITSKYEGFPLVLLEAMASGLPCIVSPLPSLRIVEEVHCGITIDLKDLHKDAQQVLKYIAGNNLEHSNNAREYVVRNLTWDIICQHYLHEFESLLDNKVKFI
jgi:glycosyltransferase involved in cell wall biosynthesis